MEEFVKLSYSRHSSGFDNCSSNGKEHDHALTWLQKDTIDYWRHKRMYELLDPILEIDKKANWLTVGDGRFGRDARYIIDNGCSALATDLTEILLKEAMNMGYIQGYKIENAEALTFDDNSFDYVFCKESYHHFPRPFIALYEMLRVAKKGVILIEPNDAYYSETIFNCIKILKNIVKLFLKRKPYSSKVTGSYEEGCANYVYSISKHELEKLALGLNYKLLAFKGINDEYVRGGEYEKLSENGIIQKRIKKQILKANKKCSYLLTDYNLLCAIIFKKIPSDDLIQSLKNNNFEIKYLSNNPYIIRDEM